MMMTSKGKGLGVHICKSLKILPSSAKQNIDMDERMWKLCILGHVRGRVSIKLFLY